MVGFRWCAISGLRSLAGSNSISRTVFQPSKLQSMAEGERTRNAFLRCGKYVWAVSWILPRSDWSLSSHISPCFRWPPLLHWKNIGTISNRSGHQHAVAQAGWFDYYLEMKTMSSLMAALSCPPKEGGCRHSGFRRTSRQSEGWRRLQSGVRSAR